MGTYGHRGAAPSREVPAEEMTDSQCCRSPSFIPDAPGTARALEKDKEGKNTGIKILDACIFDRGVNRISMTQPEEFRPKVDIGHKKLPQVTRSGHPAAFPMSMSKVIPNHKAVGWIELVAFKQVERLSS